MEKVIETYLIRLKESAQGTEGVLIIPELLFWCFSLELPWKKNIPDISCILAGTYMLSWRKQGRRPCFQICDVPGRKYILIHSGNYAGDIEKGFKTNVQGCVLLGRKFGWLSGQRAVLNSRITIREFNGKLNGLKSRIHIMGAVKND